MIRQWQRFNIFRLVFPEFMFGERTQYLNKQTIKEKKTKKKPKNVQSEMCTTRKFEGPKAAFKINRKRTVFGMEMNLTEQVRVRENKRSSGKDFDEI